MINSPASSSTPSNPSSSKPSHIDLTYSTKSGVPLPLRVWPHLSSSPTKPLPWLLWIHGGAYISGNPYTPRTWVVPSFQSKEYHIVSVGYRLAPHVSLPDQVEDCEDAYKWCLNNLEDVLGAGKVDMRRYAVGGESAGGTLATMMGVKLHPRPKAVINVYGIVDLPTFTSWSLGKQPKARPKEDGEFTEDEVKGYMNDWDATKARTAAAYYGELHNLSEEELSAKWGVGVRSDRELRLHVEMKSYTDRHHGATTVPMVMRFDDKTTPEEKERKLREVSSQYHIDGEYPPMALLHGTGDVTVPVQQSYELVKRLREVGVDYVEKYCPGAVHGWEEVYKPGDEGWIEYIQPIVDFTDHHVRA